MGGGVSQLLRRVEVLLLIPLMNVSASVPVSAGASHGVKLARAGANLAVLVLLQLVVIAVEILPAAAAVVMTVAMAVISSTVVTVIIVPVGGAKKT